MQINNYSNTNFQGGFRFPEIPTTAKNNLAEFITTKKQIFNNFEREGDLFLVTREKTNHKVAEFIRKHKLKFEFYPTINTKNGLDTEKPEGLSALISTVKEKPITTLNQLSKALRKQNRTHSVNSKRAQFTDNVLRALCIDNKHPVQTIKGATIISDKEFNRKIYISPPSKLNIHYVKVESMLADKSAERYAIDSDGNILTKFQTPDAIKIFNQRFNKLLIK